MTGLFPFFRLETQEPGAGASEGFWGWLRELAQVEGLVEVVLALAGVAFVAMVGVRLARLAEKARSRAALEDYLLGVEQALAGDLGGAGKRLKKVLAADPENHYARMLYGKVLADLGEPAEAHKHHLFLQRAFEVDSSQNDLALAGALLAAGRPGEAAEAAGRAVQAQPDRIAGLEFLFRAQLAAGLPEEATRTGERLLALLPHAERRGEIRRQAAAAAALAGTTHLRAGDRGRARALLDRARRLSDEQPEVRMLGARLQVEERGADHAMRQLLEVEASAERADLPMVGMDAGATVTLPRGLHALARLLPARRWQCSACQGELTGPVAVCPHCGAGETARSTEPELFAAVGSPTVLMDEIDENQAHIRRMVQRALEADAAAEREEAFEALVELGGAAAQELLIEGFRRPEREAEVIRILRAMGPRVVPALFDAGAALAEKRVIPLPEMLGGRSPATLVGRVVQGFGRDALPHFEDLLVSADRDQRKVLIDYFIGLGDQEEFLRVLERFPPIEILHRLNKAEPEPLRQFLAGVRPGSFVAEGLLLDTAFYREADLVAALEDAAHPEALEEVLSRRGPSRTLIKELIARLGRDPLAPAARRLLTAFGDAALDHVLAAFTDLDQEGDVRADLASLLTAQGPPAVIRICGCFGPTPSSLDGELEAVLVAMGRDTVGPLEEAYARSGLLERWSAGLVSRHSNRRVQIVRALSAIGGSEARDALARLRGGEKDPNLKLRLSQAMHKLGGGGTDAGDAGDAGRRQA